MTRRIPGQATGLALTCAMLLLAPAWAADPSFDDLAAAVDKQQAPQHSPVAAAPAARSRAPSRPLLHSYSSQPRVTVRTTVPIGRYAQIHYSPAFGYYNRGHLGFRGHYRSGFRGYHGNRYCPPGFRGRDGRW